MHSSIRTTGRNLIKCEPEAGFEQFLTIIIYWGRSFETLWHLNEICRDNLCNRLLSILYDVSASTITA